MVSDYLYSSKLENSEIISHNLFGSFFSISETLSKTLKILWIRSIRRNRFRKELLFEYKIIVWEILSFKNSTEILVFFI